MSLELKVKYLPSFVSRNPNLMARKSQHKHQGPSPTGGHCPSQRASTTGNDLGDTIEKVKTIEQLVAPVFNFPFTAIYTSELEISDSEDMLGIIAETTNQTTAQDRKYLNHENQIQYSYATVTRSWHQESQIQPGQYSSQNRTPFAVWENQAPVEEPFNDVGEVASESVGRQQGEGFDGELRRGRRQKRGGF
ncbi:hypothetical protein BDZ45DRAFT_811811 [Acephala macrosclerotiorum]|nr:hypothetical protein BDZ45DRAFT_811811 [Acephala macrosclerotiorum]